jgi:hypothetical protein
MKPLLVKTLIVGCLMGLVSIGLAQNENKKKGKKNKADATSKLRDKLASAELGEELTAKVKKIIDDNAEKLNELQAKVDGVLTADQRAARKAAQKAGQDAGKKGKALQAEVTAAMKLTDEQKTKLDEATAALNSARAEMNKAINALLSDEEQQKLGTKGGKGGKKKKNA